MPFQIPNRFSYNTNNPGDLLNYLYLAIEDINAEFANI